MNPVVSKPSSISTWLVRSVVFSVTVFAMLIAASNAKAGCGDPVHRNNGAMPNLSWLLNKSQDSDWRDSSPTIVGLWHVKYTAADQSPFLESFKTWHADGTEFENAFLPPTVGNICFGVWKESGRRSVKLHHVGVNFNPDGSLSNSFAFEEEDTVANDNKTYSGKFTFTVYDLNGKQLQQITGTTAATRITVKSPNGNPLG